MPLQPVASLGLHSFTQGTGIYACQWAECSGRLVAVVQVLLSPLYVLQLPVSSEGTSLCGCCSSAAPGRPWQQLYQRCRQAGGLVQLQPKRM